MKISAICFLFLLFSCSGLEKTEYDKIRRKNCSGDYIRRKSTDTYNLENPPKQNSPPSYSWDVNKN